LNKAASIRAVPVRPEAESPGGAGVMVGGQVRGERQPTNGRLYVAR